MKRLLLAIALAAGAVPAAGTAPLHAQSAEDEVMAVITQLFDGMREGDSAKVRATLHPSVTAASVFTNRGGEPQIRQGNLEEWVKAIGTPRDKQWDERIWDPVVHIDGLLATAWTPYAFYVGDDLSHCGVNAFQLFHSAEGWKVIRITDTRRRQGCSDTDD